MCCPKKKFWTKQKTITPPLQVKWSVPNDNNLSAEEHPSIKIIKENKKEIPKLIFHEIENDFVSKQINKANSKKATGRDEISTKF